MVEFKAGKRERAPTHPGLLIREIIEQELQLSISMAAQRIHVSRQALHAVLSGKAAVSPEMALRLARLFGKQPDLWLHMQQAHDLWHAERALAETLSQIEPIAA